MKQHWLNRKSGKRLLVFFVGWAMDERPLSHLKSTELDVLVLYDYSEPVVPMSRELLEAYEDVILAGWSMGVWALATHRNFFPANAETIAINGTLRPIDDTFGISPVIYDLTLAKLTAEVFPRFCSRMFANQAEFEAFSMPARALENQRLELESLKRQVLSQPEPECSFSRVFISEQDKIIPAKNQQAYWAGRRKTKLIPGGHYPFFRWRSFEELIDEAQRD